MKNERREASYSFILAPLLGDNRRPVPLLDNRPAG